MWSSCNISFSSSICRLCGNNSDLSNELFSSENENLTDTILTKVKRLLPLAIEENDRKPKQVCRKCVEKLSEFDSFVSMCMATDLNFNYILDASRLNKNSEFPNNLPGKCVVLLQNKPRLNENINLKVNDKNSSEGSSELGLYVMLELNYKDALSDNDTPKCREVAVNTVSIQHNSNVIPLQSFDNSITISKISATKGKDKSQKYKCNVCNKVLARQSNLTTHMAIHTEIRPYKCEHCDKSFVLPWDLSMHKHLHSGTYTCDICKKPFITKSKLARHTRSHTGVKDFPCSVCGKKFSEKNNMLVHMSVHTGVRPYTCSVCQKSFRVQSHLTDHQKVHSTYSPFQCSTCGKSFKWKTNLKDHQKFHSGEKFKCNICSKEFKLRADFYKHRKECKEDSKTCKFKCHSCNAAFKTKSELLLHKNSCTVETN